MAMPMEGPKNMNILADTIHFGPKINNMISLEEIVRTRLNPMLTKLMIEKAFKKYLRKLSWSFEYRLRAARATFERGAVS